MIFSRFPLEIPTAIFIGLVLLSQAAPGWAQTAGDVAAGGSEIEQVSTPENSETPPGVSSGAGTETETNTEPQTESNDSPFDYKSSEEISEDLSVSFPVDI